MVSRPFLRTLRNGFSSEQERFESGEGRRKRLLPSSANVARREQDAEIIAKQFRRSSFRRPSTTDEGAAITNGQSHFVNGLSCFRPPQSYGRGRPREWRILMKTLALKVQRFLTSEDGPTAVEYAVMLALIVIVCLTAIQSIGTSANTTFKAVSTQLSS
jgi:pilus assembly protein Flp/PilA